MSRPLCRWGILGAATIARKNWKAIRNAGNSALVAVASRDRERGQRFIDDCQADVPLTPMFKVDRRALRTLMEDAPSPTEA